MRPAKPTDLAQLKNSQRSGPKSGQVLIEFILALFLFFGASLFFFQYGLSAAWGNYVHYATFISARAYLAGGPTKEDQFERAKDVLVSMVKKKDAESLDRLPMVAKGVDGLGEQPSGVTGMAVLPPQEFEPDDRKSSWMEGVRYTFRSKLFMLPLSGLSTAAFKDTADKGLTLTSESWLGREPSVQECMENMQNNKGKATQVEIDNGC